jgi:hypothetical protein
MCRHTHPKFAERLNGGADTLSMQLFDMGIRFWTLKRRQPHQYAIIRRMNTLTAPYVKEAIDIDVDSDAPTHSAFDRAIMVGGAEEVVYVDIAMQSCVWLEVRLEAGLSGRGTWVRLVLAEGSVVVMPRGVTYRLRVSGRGLLGLVRGSMPASST